VLELQLHLDRVVVTGVESSSNISMGIKQVIASLAAIGCARLIPHDLM